MGYYWKPYQRAINDFVDWIFSDKQTKRMKRLVPRGCWNCEILGMCRDKQNDWKCRHGCQFIGDKEDKKDYDDGRPVKRVIVAGSRDYTNYKEAETYIDFCLSNIKKENRIIIVSGTAKGADRLGEQYAKKHNLEIKQFPADWDTYGKSAGPRRNEQMAQYSDYLICFWNGKSRGTKSMIDFAKRYQLPTKIKHIE